MNDTATDENVLWGDMTHLFESDEKPGPSSLDQPFLYPRNGRYPLKTGLNTAPDGTPLPAPATYQVWTPYFLHNVKTNLF